MIKPCNLINSYDRIPKLFNVKAEEVLKIMTTTKQNNSHKLNFKHIITSVIIIIILALGYAIKTAYSAFLTRSKVSEAFLLVHPIQNTLNEFAVKNAGYPLGVALENTSFGLPQPFEIQGTYISSVVTHKDTETSQVTIFAYINTQIIPDLEDGRDIPLSSPYIKFLGSYDGKSTQWQCSSNLATRYLPNHCSGT